MAKKKKDASYFVVVKCKNCGMNWWALLPVGFSVEVWWRSDKCKRCGCVLGVVGYEMVVTVRN